MEIARYFLTSVHVGIGGEVAYQVNRRSKILGGFLTFLLGVIIARFTYKCRHMEVTLDGEKIADEFLEIILGMGQYDGGGMNMAPYARLNNGLAEVYAIRKIGLLNTLLSLPYLYRGELDKHPAVRYLRAKRVEIRSDDTVLVSPDGESLGRLPAIVEVVPSVLRLVCGREAPVLPQPD